MAKLRKKSRSYYYWRAREVANDLAYRKKDAEYEKTLGGYYDYAMDQIQKEIDRFYSKYASAEGITLAEARQRVSQLDIDEYSRKAKKYVAEKDFTAKANAEMKLYNATMKINRLELLKAKIGLETVAAHSDAEKYMKEILGDRTIQEIKRQAGILGESIGANAKTVNSIVEASFHNAKWSDRIWSNQGLLRDELSKLLTNGLTQGKSSRELTRELRKAINVSRQNASRLMRTELSRVRNDAQLESIKRNGFEEYMFHTLSSAPFTAAKVCPICADLDGKVFKIKDAVVGDNMPPMHPNCRCSISAYEDEEEYQKWLNNYAGENAKAQSVTPTTTYTLHEGGLNVGGLHTIGPELFSRGGYSGSGKYQNPALLKLPTGTEAVLAGKNTYTAPGEYIVTNKGTLKASGKTFDVYELKRPESLNAKDYDNLIKNTENEFSKKLTTESYKDLKKFRGMKADYLANEIANAIKAKNAALAAGDQALANKIQAQIKKLQKAEAELASSEAKNKDLLGQIKTFEDAESKFNRYIKDLSIDGFDLGLSDFQDMYLKGEKLTVKDFLGDTAAFTNYKRAELQFERMARSDAEIYKLTKNKASRLSPAFTGQTSGATINSKAPASTSKPTSQLSKAQIDAKQLIDKLNLPDSYKAELKAAIDIADAEAVRLFNRYVHDQALESLTNGKAYYSHADRKVHIDLQKAFRDPRKLKTTFFHEFGHFIDFHAGSNFRGLSTKTPDFGQALRDDFDNYVKAYQKQHGIKKKTDAYTAIGQELTNLVIQDPGKKLNGVSDIFGGLSRNRARDSYGHSTNYWSANGAVEQEAFAHMYMSLFDPDKIKIMEKYFPKAYAKFRADLKGVK